jgi:hypothetical protein
VSNDETTVIRTGGQAKANRIRDGLAAVLVILGLLLPWNVYFGVGISGSRAWVFALLGIASVASLASLTVSHVGSRSIGSPAAEVKQLGTLRLALNLPYFALAAGFVALTVAQAFQYGGTAGVPAGVGPGVWTGVAGAILAAQPVVVGTETGAEKHGATVCRIIGILAIVLGLVAVLSNLYWRARFVAPNITDPETSTQNLVVLIAAILYGVVALTPVVIAGLWLTRSDAASRVATLVLGVATLLAGLLVWVMPIGRDLDAFHGIAQNTSTAGVGFEGALPWVAAAAVVGTSVVIITLSGGAVQAWRDAVRKCLVLLAVWCGGSAVLRIADVMSASALDLPTPAYNSTVMMAFDLAVALSAMWLFINSGAKSAPKRVFTVVYGALFAMTVARLIVGVQLVPRVRPLNTTDVNEVYGNTLSQQITSTFDVALCIVALVLLAVAYLQVNDIRRNARTAAARADVKPSPARPDAPPEFESVTQVLAAAAAAANESYAPGVPGAGGHDEQPVAPATVKIAPVTRTEPSTERIANVLAQSTERFAAGTTYGGSDGKPNNK